MDGLEIIGVAIGLIFVFLVLSLVCAAIQETIASFLDWRARDLYVGIRQLLRDPNFAKRFYAHPLIKGLYKFQGDKQRRVDKYATRSTEWVNERLLGQSTIPDKGEQDIDTSRLPTYIPPDTFALAVLGTLVGSNQDTSGAPSGITAEMVRNAVANVDGELQRVLQLLTRGKESSLQEIQENIEGWFNNSMDMVSGWYRRRSQYTLFWIGLVLSIVMNVNTITIGLALYHNGDLREIVVARAEVIAAQPAADKMIPEAARKELESLGLPIGWGKQDQPFNFFLALVGWTTTAFAVTFGAPFWFDLLNKFTVIRSTVKPHEKSLPEDSEDRQRK